MLNKYEDTFYNISEFIVENFRWIITLLLLVTISILALDLRELRTKYPLNQPVHNVVINKDAPVIGHTFGGVYVRLENGSREHWGKNEIQ